MSIESAKLPPVVGIILLCIVFIFIVCIAISSLERCQQDENARQDIMERERVSPTSARRLVRLARTNDWLSSSRYEISTDDRSTNESNFEDFIKYEFYTQARWVKQLEVIKELPNPDAMCIQLDLLITEIIQHSMKFNISKDAANEILRLCNQLPLHKLKKYDNYFIKDVP